MPVPQRYLLLVRLVSGTRPPSQTLTRWGDSKKKNIDRLKNICGSRLSFNLFIRVNFTPLRKENNSLNISSLFITQKKNPVTLNWRRLIKLLLEADNLVNRRRFPADSKLKSPSSFNCASLASPLLPEFLMGERNSQRTGFH